MLKSPILALGLITPVGQMGFERILCLCWDCAWCFRVERGIVSPLFLTSFLLAPVSSTPQTTPSVIS